MNRLKWELEGTTIDLSPDNGYVLVSESGVFSFPALRFEMSDLDLGGAYVRDVVAQGREVLLNIIAEDTTKRDALMAVLQVGKKGRLVAEATETRTMEAYVRAVEQVQHRGGEWAISVRFFAPWPWWLGPTQSKTFSQGARPLFFPVPPLYVTSGAVYSEETVTVDGQDVAWPTFTIIGPCDYVVLENRTLGLTLKLAQPLAAGETRIVNTRPPATVVDGTGANRMSEVEGRFWPLVPGTNQIRILAPNSSAGTSVSMTWNPSYSGAW